VPGRIAAIVLVGMLAPGCASAIASALGATGPSARAATDLDVAMARAAIEALTTSSGGETRPPPPVADAASFGGEPSFVCTIPGETEPQTLAASSVEHAVAACAAMNAIPTGEACACREAELGTTLAEPIAAR
jgi:hypothetical protein